MNAEPINCALGQRYWTHFCSSRSQFSFFLWDGNGDGNLVRSKYGVTSICLLYLSFCFDKNCLHTLASQLAALSPMFDCLSMHYGPSSLGTIFSQDTEVSVRSGRIFYPHTELN